MISWLFLSSALAAEISRKPVSTADAAALAIDNLQTVHGVVGVKCQSVPLADCSAENFKQYPRGGHGQLFFGNGPFYISHLPLWMQPHNFQAIYEVDFPESAEGQAMRKAYLSRRDKGYATFNPSTPFKIPQFNCMAGNGMTELPGEVFQGHFERGGEPLGDVKLVVKRRVYYKELNDKLPEPDGQADPAAPAEYIVFGDKDQYFAARVIDKRPAVDHILPVDGDFKSQVGGANHACFDVNRNNGQMNFKPKECADPSAPKPSTTATTAVKFQEFYLEAGELQ